MTPQEKFKKINKEYVLSDSTVNEYGFRLLTEGYQLDEFRKNPIGYYMHRREAGVALKWDELRVDNDKVIGVPVINLSNERGEQTYDEAENGFLNAASVGHIVVLEYSTDPQLMLPGQTGPTITKWYNKECSLVDIPGNCNSLTKLYDAQENEINLVDLNINPIVMKKPSAAVLPDLYSVLKLAENTDEQAMLAAVKHIVLKAEELELDNNMLRNDRNNLLQKIDDINRTHTKYEVAALLDKALEDKKVTRELKDKLAIDYADNPEGLKNLISAMPAYRSIVENLKATERDKAELQWNWDAFEANDPSGRKLRELKANNPERYQEIFKEKFGG